MRRGGLIRFISILEFSYDGVIPFHMGMVEAEEERNGEEDRPGGKKKVCVYGHASRPDHMGRQGHIGQCGQKGYHLYRNDTHPAKDGVSEGVAVKLHDLPLSCHGQGRGVTHIKDERN